MKRNSNIELNTIYFWTVTINNWYNLLEKESFKHTIIDSINYLSENKKMQVYAFVIMPNHIHLVIQSLALNGKEKPTASFLKYTAHQFKKLLLAEDATLLQKFKVSRANKNYEFWQRDSLAIEIFDIQMAWQKIDYIHNNPLASHWQLCTIPENYMYSSAQYYLMNNKTFNFLHHIQDAM